MNTEASAKEKLILVVDDEESIRGYLATLLASEGYEVALAEGGEEAVEMIKQGIGPALIILDIMMPRMAWRRFGKSTKSTPTFRW